MTTAPLATTYTLIISKLVVIFIIVFFPFYKPKAIVASIVINELLPNLPSGKDEKELEWIELYNTSDSSIDVNGYTLKDEKEAELIISSTHTESGTTILSPKSYLVIYRRGASITLNNNADTVYLFESTQSAQPIDQVLYSSTKENKSWGRVPDGESQVVAHLAPTPGKPNAPPSTATPKPTSTPKPKATKKPTTPKPVYTTPPTTHSLESNQLETSTLTNSTSQDNLNEIVNQENSTSTHAAVLGITQLSPPSTPTASTNASVTDLIDTTSSPTKSWLFFIGSGLLFAAAAVIRLKQRFSI